MTTLLSFVAVWIEVKAMAAAAGAVAASSPPSTMTWLSFISIRNSNLDIKATKATAITTTAPTTFAEYQELAKLHCHFIHQHQLQHTRGSTTTTTSSNSSTATCRYKSKLVSSSSNSNNTITTAITTTIITATTATATLPPQSQT